MGLKAAKRTAPSSGWGQSVLPLPQADPPCQRKGWGFDFPRSPASYARRCPGPPGRPRTRCRSCAATRAVRADRRLGRRRRDRRLASPCASPGRTPTRSRCSTSSPPSTDARSPRRGRRRLVRLPRLRRSAARARAPPGRRRRARCRCPPFALAFYDHVLRRDADGRWWFEALWTPERAAALARGASALRARGSPRGRAAPARSAAAPWRRPGPAGHAARSPPAASASPPATSSRRTSACGWSPRSTATPLDLFAAGVAALRPDRAAFVARRGRGREPVARAVPRAAAAATVRSAPIKGTRPRGRRRARARSLREGPRRERDDRRPLRNDLGRVCEPGTRPRSRRSPSRGRTTGVWHLVSEVAGPLRRGVGDADLLRATFPPGSVTGAPKVAALESSPSWRARAARSTPARSASRARSRASSSASRSGPSSSPRAGAHGSASAAASSPTPTPSASSPRLRKAAPAARRAAARARAGPAPAPGAPPRVAPRPPPAPTRRAACSRRCACATARLPARRPPRAAARERGELYGRELPAGAAPRPCDRGARRRRRAGAAADRARRRRRGRAPGRAGRRRPAAASRPAVAARRPGRAQVGRPPAARRARGASGAMPLLVDLDGPCSRPRRQRVVVEARALVTPPADGRILAGVTRARSCPRGARLGRARSRSRSTASRPPTPSSSRPRCAWRLPPRSFRGVAPPAVAPSSTSRLAAVPGGAPLTAGLPRGAGGVGSMPRGVAGTLQRGSGRDHIAVSPGRSPTLLLAGSGLVGRAGRVVRRAGRRGHARRPPTAPARRPTCTSCRTGCSTRSAPPRSRRRSRPDGTQVAGTWLVHLGGGNGPTYRGDVTCLSVAGNRAVVGVEGTVIDIRGTPFPFVGLIGLVDGGPPSGRCRTFVPVALPGRLRSAGRLRVPRASPAGPAPAACPSRPDRCRAPSSGPCSPTTSRSSTRPPRSNASAAAGGRSGSRTRAWSPPRPAGRSPERPAQRGSKRSSALRTS